MYLPDYDKSYPLIVPSGLTLRPYQEEATRLMIHFLTHNETNSTYNGSDPGLGKTVETITVLNTFFKPQISNPHILIICPKSMRYTWRNEINTWATFESDIIVPKDSKAVSAWEAKFGKFAVKPLILILTYELATRSITALRKVPWDILIYDEMHKLKTESAKRTKALLGALWRYSNYKIALSGTPFTKSITDGFTAFNAMCPSLFPDFNIFANTYAYRRVTPWAEEWYGVKNEKQLSDIIRKNFYFRHAQTDVLADLPQKTYQKIELPEEYAAKPPPNEALLLKNQVEVLIQRLQHEHSIAVIPDSAAALRRIQGSKNAPAVIEFAKELLEQNIPLVLFGWHHDTISLYKAGLKKFNPVGIVGGTPEKLRNISIKKFQDGETDLFIGSLGAAAECITLTRAKAVILGEIDYDPTKIKQGTRRVHRFGVKHPVTVYYFVTKNSIDEDIIEIVMSKARAFDKVLEE